MDRKEKISISRGPSQLDKNAVREFFAKMPLIERSSPVTREMLWVLGGRPNPVEHQKQLPEYCYNIFDVFQKTYFKGFPLLADTILVTDQVGLTAAKSVEETRKVVRLDWKNLGRLFGIGMRCMRFAELEAKDVLNDVGLAQLSPDRRIQTYTEIFGEKWVSENQSKLSTEAPAEILSEKLNEEVASSSSIMQSMLPQWDASAYQWSPEAMAEFHAGLAEGTKSFLDANGELSGESSRSNIYNFLLVAWPEIKEMIESIPGRTVTDLHEWMKPFMHVGLTAYVELETLRDVCAPPSQHGIGLQLRKLNSH